MLISECYILITECCNLVAKRLLSVGLYYLYKEDFIESITRICADYTDKQSDLLAWRWDFRMITFQAGR